MINITFPDGSVRQYESGVSAYDIAHSISPKLAAEVMAANKLIINASPVGTYPRVEDAPALPYHLLTAEHLLFDLVYNPERTLFAERAATMGAHTLCGLDMLYAQAESAWQIWNE